MKGGVINFRAGAKLPKIPVQVGSHTTNQKLLFLRNEEVVSY